MCSLFKIFGIGFLVFCSLVTDVERMAAQSPEYTVESFQGVYEELTEYESIALLTEGDPLWEYEFDFEFPFPFYDSVYTGIYYEQDAWGQFTDDDFAVFLMANANSYTYDNVIDPFNITSDVRFSHVTSMGVRAFVLQFTKARFFGDPFKDSLDTYLNFQIWFYENGILEVHFGDMHFDDSPIYSPGDGFFCYTSGGGVDSTDVCGPVCGIYDPLDEDNVIAVAGPYDDYDVLGHIAPLTVIPPEGWVIRFVPVWVSVDDPVSHIEHYIVSPNPTESYINIPEGCSHVMLYDLAGSVVMDKAVYNARLYLAEVPSGIYLVHFIAEDRIYIGKVVKF